MHKKETKKITFDITAEHKKMLKFASFHRGITQTQLLAKIIDYWFENNEIESEK